jgi:two-component system OmpR family sensor kinase
MPIRLRVSAAFTLALAIAFALGSWLLVSQVSAVVFQAVDTGLALQLSQADRLLPVTAGSARGGNLLPSDYMVQLIDTGGRVRATSPDTSRVPLLTPAQQGQARLHVIRLNTTIDGDPSRLMGEPLAARRGWVAVAAISTESADSTVSAVVSRLAVGGTIFIVVAAIGAYLLARAALAPAERMRREAAALSEHDPAGRLPVPSTRDEISALARTINDLLGRLQQALARQRALVADASHELRTPLAVLRAELELAAKPGRSREQLAEAVASAADEAARLNRVTDDLLLLARSDEDQLRARREITDVSALLRQSVERAAARCVDAGVSCVVDAPSSLDAAADPHQLRRAIDNLVDNTLRYAPSGSTIRVAALASGADLLIRVSDDGPGFPRDYLPHAFERFTRPDTGRARSAGGAGLGLAIVSAVARAHGGFATARNGPAGGAEVQLDLPGALALPAAGSPA